MAPPPPTRVQIQRLVSVLLHCVVALGHLVGLVCTVIAAAQRTTWKLPAMRLVVFGTIFITYLVLKAFEIAVPQAWFTLKRWMDEISLLIGGLSLVSIVYISTKSFTYYVAVPAYVVVVVGWILFRTGLFVRFFNWTYIKYFKVQKSFRISSCKRVLKRKVLHCTDANSAYKDACMTITTELSSQDFQIAVTNAEHKKQILLDAIRAVSEAQDSLDLCIRECDLKIEEAAITYEEYEV